MKKLTLAEVATLLRPCAGPCVTIYITARKQGLWAPRTLRRYRGLLDTASSRLTRLFPKQASASLLDELRLYSSLESEVGDNFQALAFFCSPGFSGYFAVPANQAPTPSHTTVHLDDGCSVGERFHLTPISDFINPTHGWFVAKMTKGGLRVYRGQGPALEEHSALEWPDHPRVAAQQTRALSKKAAESARFVRFSSADHARLDDHLTENLSETDRRLPIVLCGTKTDIEAYLRETEHSFDAVIPISERYHERDASSLLRLAWPRVSEHFEQDWRMALAGLTHAVKLGLSTCDPQQIARRLNAGILKLIAVSAEHGLASVPEDMLHRAMELGCKVFLCQPDELPMGAPVLAI